ncbi:hypothetical protein SAMN04244579_02686 [Azotobacter beijerinckii]|uniref:Uncharacterized protein n=1 Tax=Azotobacter beijerinckii TaxID=170623 RepID=A0A1H6V1E2_9GAMM|nr:hypothetical protein [Azotobacter beijerinckii]SEI98321.1 hypothetical protein SAMN04244579_02686 [Azotobacter beijerinckii]
MQTPKKLRAEIEDARRAAHAAPNRESAASDWATVSRLEAELRKLEGREETEDQRLAERFRIEMVHARNRARSAEKRVAMLERVISSQIGKPLDGMSEVNICESLSKINKDRQDLARWIVSAHDMAGLEHAKRVARNLGLPRQPEPLAAQFARMGFDVRAHA